MRGLGGKVAIIGTGTIKFGENFHQSLTDMIFEAANLAMADAGIESRQLQAAWLGCYEPFLYGFEGNSGTFVSDPLNLFPHPRDTRGRLLRHGHRGSPQRRPRCRLWRVRPRPRHRGGEDA